MNNITKILWAIAISFIFLNSIYFSIKLKFPQFKLFKSVKSVLKRKNNCDISPVDTLVMALSSKIGVGSLSGTALCIYYAGCGTIFWILLSTFFLSILNYIENGLSIIYKKKGNNPKSGPYYYIKKGLGNKYLSIVYAVLVLFTYIFLFTSIQNNTITVLTTSVFHINKILVSLVITTLASFSIIKGIKAISNACNNIFPIMMLIFIAISFTILVRYFEYLPHIFELITKDAFNYKPVVGGILHIIIFSLQKSVFANEAGVGTSAIISGSTNSDDYKLQAKLGLISTYFINFIVLGFTALIIITADKINPDVVNGIEFTKAAFYYHFGNIGEYILLLILVLFSFSTIITIYYYGESCLSFLTNNNFLVKVLKIVTIICIFIGGIIKATAIWNLINIFLAILTIINMYAIYKLKDVIISKLKE